MTPRLPRIRHRAPFPIRRRLSDDSQRLQRVLLARDVVRIAFHMPYDHPEIASGVSHAVESYVRAVGQGPRTIHHAFINDDEGDTLTEERWATSAGTSGPSARTASSKS